MKKILFILSIFVLLQACDKDKISDTKNTNAISFWHFWSEPYQQEIVDSLIINFEKEENCTVNTTLLSWNDGKMKLTAAFNSNTAPDVIELGSDWTAQFASAGVLYEFNPQECDFTRFLDFSLIPSIWDEKYYAVPWTVATRALFCNKDLLKEINITSDSILTNLDYNQLFTLASEINKIETAKGIGINSSDAHRLYKKILPVFWSYGGGIFDNTGKLIIDSEENIRALDMYCKLARAGFIETQRQIDATFVKGNTGFCISGPWLDEKIKNENPDLDYRVCLMPNSENAQGMSFTGGEYLSINNKSEKIELSKKLIKYLTKGENAVKFCSEITAAGFPADKNFYSAPELMKYSNNKVYAKQLEYSKMTPMHPKWLDIEAIIEAITVEALYGNSTPKQALQKAKKMINNITN